MPDAAVPRLSWITRHIPNRDTVHENRFLRPFAHRLAKPELWRMHHRSVPRAVALGLGIGVIIPFMHMVIAAVLAIPLRANVAVAAATTLLINPLTIPPMYYLAYRTGLWELRADAAVMDPSAAQHASGELARVLFWVHHASGPIALGILTVAIAAAAIGYAVTAILWRWRLMYKRSRRQRERLSNS